MTNDRFLPELEFAPVFIELGRTLLQAPNLTDYIAEIEKDISSVKAEEAVYIGLEKDFKNLCEAADDAKRYLSQVRLFFPDEDDDITTADAPLAAFRVLDNLVFLRDGLEHAIKKDMFKDTSLIPKLEQCHLDITAWVGGEGGFSVLRLTVFQDIRKDVLSTFRDEVHYLFPWYHSMSMEQQDILVEITSYYNKIADPNKHGELPRSLQENALFYYMELAADHDLRFALAKEHKIWHAIGEGFSKSLATRLFAVVEDASLNTSYPKGLIKYGFGAIAAQLLKNAKNIWMNRKEQVGMVLLAGFCCEGLSYELRFKLFSWVEDHMPGEEIGVSENPGIGERALSRLNTWSIGKTIGSEWLYNREHYDGLYGLWFNEMQKNKGKVAIADMVTEEELCQLAEGMIKTYDGLTQVLNVLGSWVVNVLSPIKERLFPQPVYRLRYRLRGRGGGAEPSLPQFNLIGVPKTLNPEGGQATFLDGSPVEEVTNLLEYAWDNEWYFCAVALGADVKFLETWSPTPLPDDGQVKLDLPPNVAAVLIGIGEKEHLKREWADFHSSDPRTDDAQSDVFWLLYGPPADKKEDSPG